ncbi:MAG: esterase [Deltaproteobacteria bacterium]|nr:esterase [Deltaproteobacteria bacterium]
MIARRGFLAGLVLSSCTRKDKNAEGAPPVAPIKLPEMPPADAGIAPRGKVGTDTWTFESTGFRAVVIVPSWTPPGDRLPALLALHGRGEALKGPVDGAMGWPRDYALLRAIDRVCNPPVTSTDLEGFVDPKRLADMNAGLAQRPFKGLVVVCPYSPDVELRKPKQVKEYGDFLLRAVIPRVKKELPVLSSPGAFGIDGVSLGGALALRTGLANADAFGTVGSLQAAIGEDQVQEFVDLAKSARQKNAAVKLRLLTSNEDYFRSAISRVSQGLKAAGVDHDYADIPGPHDYPFNRGPGAIEMLLWHDRLLPRT